MDKITYKPIGIIYSPFKEPKGTPIQPEGARGAKGRVEVMPEYSEGLQDLDGFSHVILIYHFHLSKKTSLKVKPFLDDQEHGIFAIRGPSRPNPIGISVVRLIRVDQNILHVQDLDIVDGTPLLDIKPYVPRFDTRQAEKTGWLDEKVEGFSGLRDDGRFSE